MGFFNALAFGLTGAVRREWEVFLGLHDDEAKEAALPPEKEVEMRTSSTDAADGPPADAAADLEDVDLDDKGIV